MDNRRPTGSAPATPYNQSREQNTEGDRRYRGGSQTGGQQGEYRKYPPRDSNFPPRDRDDRFRRSGERSEDRSRTPDRNRPDMRERQPDRDRFPRREENRFRPNPPDNRFRPNNEDSRYRPNNEENRFRPNNEENRFRPSNDRYPRKPGMQNNDRYPRNDRFQNDRPAGKFTPGRGFTPKPKANDWKTAPKPKIYDEMQVTDGKHIGKFLQTTASTTVRPTARRIREVMFRLIFRRVRARRFLDLCAGSGTVGIEAISRGALLCTFVERSAKMCGFIRKNMASLEIKEGHGEIHEIEVVPFLKRMQKRKRFWDVVFFDPPYDTNYDEVLEYFKRGVAVRPGGLLVIEHHTEMFFPETLGILRRAKVINQGDTSLSFYERKF